MTPFDDEEVPPGSKDTEERRRMSVSRQVLVFPSCQPRIDRAMRPEKVRRAKGTGARRAFFDEALPGRELLVDGTMVVSVPETPLKGPFVLSRPSPRYFFRKPSSAVVAAGVAAGGVVGTRVATADGRSLSRRRRSHKSKHEKKPTGKQEKKKDEKSFSIEVPRPSSTSTATTCSKYTSDDLFSFYDLLLKSEHSENELTTAHN